MTTTDATEPADRTGTDLPAVASQISQQLRDHGFPVEDAVTRQVLALAKEVGEFVGAYRRWAGLARRTGTAAEMYAELADVVIAAYVTAEELGIDLGAAIAAKLDVVFTRGWREPADLVPPGCPTPRPATGRRR